MPRKRKVVTSPHRAQPQAQPAANKPNQLLTALAIAGVVVAALGIILLKQRSQPAMALPAASTGSNTPAAYGSLNPGSPADQLERALAAGQPVLVFMHSTNCHSCVDMMNVVNQVYPEFADQVALVDVDVYDEANIPLMRKLGLRYIPTVIVFNREGRARQNVGAMSADAFRSFLRQGALGG